MQKKTASAIYLILVFGLANCSGGFSAPVVARTPKAIGQTSIPTEPLQTASPIRMNPTATSTLLPTTTATSDNGITKNCLTILPALPQPNKYQGKLILNNFLSKDEYLYDIQTAQTTKMPNHGYLDIAVTPDGKKYA